MATLGSLSAGAFRANVGAVIINYQGKVLAFQRKNMSDIWQCPQGGIEADEEPVDAVFREVEEETSIPKQKLDLVAEHPEWLAYEIPKEVRPGARGQVQKWFVLRLNDLAVEIDLAKATETEFSAWKWTTLAALCEDVVYFKRQVYRRICQDFAEHLAG